MIFKRKYKNLSNKFKFVQIYINQLFIKIQKYIFGEKKIEFILLDNTLTMTYYRSSTEFSFSRNIIEHVIKYPKVVDKLKEDLDRESINLIDRVLFRMKYIYTNNILEKRKLVTRKEIEERKKEIEYLKNYQKLKTERGEVGSDTSQYYYKHGLKYVPNEFIRKLNNKDFIDGGAYYGDSAHMFERDFNPKNIYSFEPEINNFQNLLKVIKLNNLKKVIPIQMALGEKECILRMDTKGCASRIKENVGQETRIITIDNYVENQNLNVGLIKLDVEGYGLRALKGAERTIKKFKPVLLISIYHNAEEFFFVKDFIKNLNLDYKFIIRKLGALKAITATDFIAW